MEFEKPQYSALEIQKRYEKGMKKSKLDLLEKNESQNDEVIASEDNNIDTEEIDKEPEISLIQKNVLENKEETELPNLRKSKREGVRKDYIGMCNLNISNGYEFVSFIARRNEKTKELGKDIKINDEKLKKGKDKKQVTFNDKLTVRTFEKNLEGDDYFERQDLDIAFRNNSIQENLNNISLVNQNGAGAKLIICSVAPINVVERTDSVGFDKYWWAPLVDNPDQPDSLTRELVEATKLPAMNTGGTVGTAAWVFALTTLKVPKIAVVGMDLGYYFADTSHLQTQSYYILKNLVGEKNMHEYYPEFVYPATGERFYTDPTYYWYRNNMLALLSSSGSTVYNCTGGGTLIGPGVECLEIEEFIKLNN